jgi:TPR repeat protein
MARFELSNCNSAALAEGPTSANTLLELGMMYSVGRNVPVDYVTAHKWFNLAAMQGHRDAARLRQEVAEQMSDVEIAAAQRAARTWLRTH